MISDWQEKFNEGRNCISNEEYDKARFLLEQALEGCPDEDNQVAGEIVFEIGRAFFGIGMRGIAISNMLAGVKLGAKEPHTDGMMENIINEYGMPAQPDRELDDKAAFIAIHIMRYLHGKRSGRFGTLAEKDMINELVMEAWKDFRCGINLAGLATREKVSKIREYVIIFPTFSVPDLSYADDDNIFYADFRSDLCSCGSGLPYMWCCGRIKSLDELESGNF